MVDSSFGHWFAGFTDGEGCFTIQPVSKYFYCKFTIGVRADDGAVLREIHHELGIGSIRDKMSPSMSGHPQVTFDVTSKSDCLVLREVFCTYPLRAKKAEDFTIWSHALDISVPRCKTDGYYEEMRSLKTRLEANRKYREVENV
jgi:hypothetical protein